MYIILRDNHALCISNKKYKDSFQKSNIKSSSVIPFKSPLFSISKSHSFFSKTHHPKTYNIKKPRRNFKINYFYSPTSTSHHPNLPIPLSIQSIIFKSPIQSHSFSSLLHPSTPILLNLHFQPGIHLQFSKPSLPFYLHFLQI